MFMPSNNEYYKEYRTAEREVKSGKRENMIDETTPIKFDSKQVTTSQFKKHYKDRIDNKEVEYIFNNCLDLITLIQSDKDCLAKEGAYIKNCTGTMKVNPAQKELRENLKIFNAQLLLLHQLTDTKESKDEVGDEFGI